MTTANALRDLLRPHLSLFVRTDHPRLLGAGAEVTTYAKILKADSRLTVILLRPQWGKAQWTAVAEAAIRERVRLTGHPVVVVAMEDDIAPLAWLPPTTPYRAGWIETHEETASAIIAKAVEVGILASISRVT